MRSSPSIKYPRNRSEAIRIINLLDLEWRLGKSASGKRMVIDFAKEAFRTASRENLDDVCNELKRWVRIRGIPVRLQADEAK